MKLSLDRFERGVRFLLAAFALGAAFGLYQHPLARAAAMGIGFYLLWEGWTGVCPLHARLSGLFGGLSAEKRHLIGLAAIQVVMAYEWFGAGIGKVLSGTFPQNLGGTLTRFSSENPFPWYKGLLEGFVIPNATTIGYLVEWMQILIALLLAVGAAAMLWAKDAVTRRKALIASVVALGIGALLNANFYLASGWTGASGKGVNYVMFWAQAILAYVWIQKWVRKET